MSGEEAGSALDTASFSLPNPSRLSSCHSPQNFPRVTREHLELGEEVDRLGGR